MSTRSDIRHIKREAHIAAQAEAIQLASHEYGGSLHKRSLDWLERAGFGRFLIDPAKAHGPQPISRSYRYGEIGETWVRWAWFSRAEVEAYAKAFEEEFLFDASEDREDGEECPCIGCEGLLTQTRRGLKCQSCGEYSHSRQDRENELILALVGWDKFESGVGREFGIEPGIKIGKHHILVKQMGGLDV
jgi:hypothetical protein